MIDFHPESDTVKYISEPDMCKDKVNDGKAGTWRIEDEFIE